MDKMQAFQSFWSQFGYSAFDESTVPENAKLPYITYEAAADDLNHPVLLSVSLWDRSTSWAVLESLKNNIYAKITRGGVIQKYDGGALWVKTGTPFAQRLSDPDDMIRRIILNIEVEYFD